MFLREFTVQGMKQGVPGNNRLLFLLALNQLISRDRSPALRDGQYLIGHHFNISVPRCPRNTEHGIQPAPRGCPSRRHKGTRERDMHKPAMANWGYDSDLLHTYQVPGQ